GKACGDSLAEGLGTAKEIVDVWLSAITDDVATLKGVVLDSVDDLIKDAIGIDCAHNKCYDSCKECCKDKL
ncbi:MAG: hypothetical protein AAB431_04180, partial [Patescibacteria group bacterium]